MCRELGEAPPRPVRIIRGRLVIGALEIWIRRASEVRWMLGAERRGSGARVDSRWKVLPKVRIVRTGTSGRAFAHFS